MKWTTYELVFASADKCSDVTFEARDDEMAKDVAIATLFDEKGNWTYCDVLDANKCPVASFVATDF